MQYNQIKNKIEMYKYGGAMRMTGKILLTSVFDLIQKPKVA